MLVFVTWAYGLCSTFICFLYRHTLRWAEYYGRSFPCVYAWIIDMFVETFSCRLWDPRYPPTHPWPVQTHLFPPPSPPTPQEGSGTIGADGGAAKGDGGGVGGRRREAIEAAEAAAEAAAGAAAEAAAEAAQSLTTGTR